MVQNTSAGLDDLKVMHTHEDKENDHCLEMCAGTTPLGQGWSEQKLSTYKVWSKFGNLFIKTAVNISACNFTRTPIIDTTLDFDSKKLTYLKDLAQAARIAGSSKITGATKTSFSVYLNGYEGDNTRNSLTASFGNKHLSIHWNAIGYIKCRAEED